MKPFGPRSVLVCGLVACAAWPLAGCGGGANRSDARGDAADAGDAFVVDGAPDAPMTDATTVSDRSNDGAPLARVLASFDPFADAGPGTEGFAIGLEDEPGNVGAARDGGVGAALSWTGDDGDPSKGALTSDVPFDGYGEFVDVQKSYGTSFPQDWSGKTTLTAWVKIASVPAGDPPFPFAIQLYAQSFSGTADGGASSCPPSPAKCYLPASHPSDGGVATIETCSSVTTAPAGNGWTQYRLDLGTCAAAFTRDTIVAFGVIVQSGAAPGEAGDASATDAGDDAVSDGPAPAPDGGGAETGDAGSLGDAPGVAILLDTFTLD